MKRGMFGNKIKSSRTAGNEQNSIVGYVEGYHAIMQVCKLKQLAVSNLSYTAYVSHLFNISIELY